MIFRWNSIYFLFFATFFLYSNSALSLVYKDDTLQFELLDSWSCEYNENTWICSRSFGASNDYQEIKIETKRRGAKDSLIQYLVKRKELISQFQSQSKRNSKKLSSNIIRKILGRRWVESLAVGKKDENENEYDYFLATTEENTAVLISFKSRKSHYKNIKYNVNWILWSMKVSPYVFSSRCDFIPDENQGGGCIISGKWDCY